MICKILSEMTTEYNGDFKIIPREIQYKRFVNNKKNDTCIATGSAYFSFTFCM